jgi:diguanylate cyclase (GGDEF)-like protein
MQVRGRTGGIPASVVALFVVVALFASGIVWRPPGEGWAKVYDLGLYNAIYLCGARIAWNASRRVPGQRDAWRCLSAALVVYACAELTYSWVVARADEEPYPSVADALFLAYYPLLYCTVIRIARARIIRFHPSIWLDGVISALGAAALGVAALVQPSLGATEGDFAVVATNLAYPVADVLLLAVLVAVMAVLRLRADRVLLLLGGGMVCMLTADVVFLRLEAADVYVEGGLLDLVWIVGAALTALAAHAANAGSTKAQPAGKPISWRVIAVPLVSILASLALLGAGWGDELPPVAAWCAIGCVLASFARTSLTFREIRDLREVRQQARTDELTALPNRRALLETAERYLLESTGDSPVALLLIDLDGFKGVNDGLGHHAGDELLRRLGPRLRGVLRDGDLLARLGGDEFAVLLPATSASSASALAERILERLRQPFVIEGVRLHVGGSIGVATGPVAAGTVAELLRCADVAMYAAKSDRSGVQAYTPGSDGNTGELLRLVDDLRTGLERGELVVHVQPQVSLRNGAVVGAEALVRWQHPQRGLLSPAAILAAAEQAGLLRTLADEVLELALAGAARWWANGSQVPVSVNLSAADVTDLDLPAKVVATLDRHGLPPEALTLELVEDTLMSDPERAHVVLGDLRALGVRTSIDDYGTGHSPLANLRRLPADELKLDRTFTTDLDTDPRAAAIVEHTVALAHALSLRLVAEGIDDLRTAEILASLGCDVAQGFAIARPMPVDDFLPWIDTWPTSHAASWAGVAHV